MGYRMKAALFAIGSTSGCNPSQNDHNLADYLWVTSTLVKFRT